MNNMLFFGVIDMYDTKLDESVFFVTKSFMNGDDMDKEMIYIEEEVKQRLGSKFQKEIDVEYTICGTYADKRIFDIERWRNSCDRHPVGYMNHEPYVNFMMKIKAFPLDCSF